MINKTDKPATYISTGDVAGLQNGCYKGWVRVRLWLKLGLGLRLGLVLG